jgi:hypothetical protein
MSLIKPTSSLLSAVVSLVLLTGAPAQPPLIITAQDPTSGIITLQPVDLAPDPTLPTVAIQPPAEEVNPSRPSRVEPSFSSIRLPEAGSIEVSSPGIELPTVSVTLEPPRLQWKRVLLEGIEASRETPIPQLDLYARLLTLPEGVFYSGTWPEVERARQLELATQGRADEAAVNRLEEVWRQALTRQSQTE